MWVVFNHHPQTVYGILWHWVDHYFLQINLWQIHHFEIMFRWVPGPRLRVAIQAFWTWRSEGRGGALGAGRVAGKVAMTIGKYRERRGR